ncbi:MAG: trypsin-like peptidase domain-containing protein [Pseudomonadota bacterium]
MVNVVVLTLISFLIATANAAPQRRLPTPEDARNSVVSVLTSASAETLTHADSVHSGFFIRYGAETLLVSQSNLAAGYPSLWVSTSTGNQYRILSVAVDEYSGIMLGKVDFRGDPVPPPLPLAPADHDYVGGQSVVFIGGAILPGQSIVQGSLIQNDEVVKRLGDNKIVLATTGTSSTRKMAGGPVWDTDQGVIGVHCLKVPHDGEDYKVFMPVGYLRTFLARAVPSSSRPATFIPVSGWYDAWRRSNGDIERRMGQELNEEHTDVVISLFKKIPSNSSRSPTAWWLYASALLIDDLTNHSTYNYWFYGWGDKTLKKAHDAFVAAITGFSARRELEDFFPHEQSHVGLALTGAVYRNRKLVMSNYRWLNSHGSPYADSLEADKLAASFIDKKAAR